MDGSPQQVSDLADELGVGRLRVFNALKRLQKSGWAEYVGSGRFQCSVPVEFR